MNTFWFHLCVRIHHVCMHVLRVCAHVHCVCVHMVVYKNMHTSSIHAYLGLQTQLYA